MIFTDIIGQQHIKHHLTKSADEGRIAHAQLFIGNSGSGTLPMALAYAKYLLGKHTNNAEALDAKFKNYSHPDLHFAFPVTTSDKAKSNPVSSQYLDDWRKMITTKPYSTLTDWYNTIGVTNKQGLISVHEAHAISKALVLKAYEGGYKVMIIWMAEKMNTACANKLLKLIEEPPKDTIFILIAENEDQLLGTIKSRCQILHFPPLADDAITNGLVKHFNIDVQTAALIAHNAEGNYNKAYKEINQNQENTVFETWFIAWVRAAFRAKGNKAAIHHLIQWAEDVAKTGRESQKRFLLFCINCFRQALLLNYNTKNLVHFTPKTSGFKLENFAPFIHNNNIIPIIKEVEMAIYHIERNGNAKLILTDLSIKLTRLIHKKSQA